MKETFDTSYFDEIFLEDFDNINQFNFIWLHIIKYFYSTNDPCYGYFLGKDSNGVNNIKLYFPKRNKDKGSVLERYYKSFLHAIDGIIYAAKYEHNIIIIICATILVVVLSLIFIKRSGLYGFCYASIIANLSL